MIGDARRASPTGEVEIDLAMDLAWERTFGEGGAEEIVDGEEIGGGTVLCVSPYGPAVRPTHASIDEALRDEVDRREAGTERRPLSYVVDPVCPLRYVCLVEHVEAGDIFVVAAPTLGEFQRVVLERRSARKMVGQARLTWLPMKIGSEVDR